MKFTKSRFFKKREEQVEVEKVVEEVKPKMEMQFIPKDKPKEETVKQIYDEEIINRNLSFYNSIDSTRVQGSQSERATANKMLAHLEGVLDHKGTIEPFYVNNLLHKYGLLFISAIFLLSLIIYNFSPISALLIYLIGVIAVVSRVVFKVDLLGFFKKDISFNVVNEVEKKPSFTNTLIITSNYSSTNNWNINKFFKVNTKALFITMSVIFFITFIFLIVLSAGVESVAIKVLTGLLLTAIVLVLALFYTKATNKNSKNGLSGVATASMIVDYLNNHKGLIGDNTKVVFCSFGGGIDSTNGAKAFIKQHCKNNDDYPNAVVVDLSCTNATKPVIYTLNGESKISNMAYEKLGTQGFTKERPLFKGGVIKECKSVGVDAVSFGESLKELGTDFNTAKDSGLLDKTQSMESFYTYLNFISDVLIKLKNN